MNFFLNTGKFLKGYYHYMKECMKSLEVMLLYACNALSQSIEILLGFFIIYQSMKYTLLEESRIIFEKNTSFL